MMEVSESVVRENKALVEREFASTWNEGHLEEEWYAEDFAYHGLAPEPLDYDALVEDVAGFRAAFPDLHKTIEACIGEGDLVSLRYSATMTHEGEFAGVEPTERAVEATGMVLYRVTDGRIAEAWINYDALGILQGIGALPSH